MRCCWCCGGGRGGQSDPWPILTAIDRAVPVTVLRGGRGGWRRESVPRRALRLCPRRGPTQANAPPPPPDRRPRGGPDCSLDGGHAAAGRERRQRPERRCLQGALQALLCARTAHGAAPLAAGPADDAAAPPGGRARAQGQIARRVAPWAAPPRNLAPNIKDGLFGWEPR